MKCSRVWQQSMSNPPFPTNIIDTFTRVDPRVCFCDISWVLTPQSRMWRDGGICPLPVPPPSAQHLFGWFRQLRSRWKLRYIITAANWPLVMFVGCCAESYGKHFASSFQHWMMHRSLLLSGSRWCRSIAMQSLHWAWTPALCPPLCFTTKCRGGHFWQIHSQRGLLDFMIYRLSNTWDNFWIFFLTNCYRLC